MRQLRSDRATNGLLIRAATIVLILSASLAARREARADVVINELFYNAPFDQVLLEFVELHNTGTEAVDLSGWRFTKGIKFTFAAGSRLDAGGFLVVCRDPEAFRSAYGAEPAPVGQYQGGLSNQGERLTLSDAQGRAVDSVRFKDRSPWPVAADGYGASLERISGKHAGDSPYNWASSPLSEKTLKAGGTPGKANANAAAAPGPAVLALDLDPASPRPEKPIAVRIRAVAETEKAELIYQTATPGKVAEEKRIAMNLEETAAKGGGKVFTCKLPGQPEHRLIRFRVELTAGKHTRRTPSVHALRPMFSTYVRSESAPTSIAQARLLHVSAASLQKAKQTQFGSLFGFGPARFGGPKPEPAARGAECFVYVSADGRTHQTFDFVNIVARRGGFKVRFHKDRLLRHEPSDKAGRAVKEGKETRLKTINLLFENNPRFVLAEPMAYQIYQAAGVPSPLSDHLRLHIDGKPQGYHLLVEQPNRTFLRRHGRKDRGNLYKILWYRRGLVGSHEKKTNLTTGHDDLIASVRALNKAADDAQQWEIIQKEFNVDVFASYFAVNMCLSNWDGFFNNYFTYHDVGGTGKWEIYPWDEDKTWGFYDRLPRGQVYYDMPLTFGMNEAGGGGRGQFAFFRPGWKVYRPPGVFSGPLLANPKFRTRFLRRLQTLLDTVYTEKAVKPRLEALRKRLEPEVIVRAKALGLNQQAALRRFASDLASLEEHLRRRREFLLAQPELKSIGTKRPRN